MTPDEVRLLDNQYALLFIRGENPIIDIKYDILKHKNIALTTDGGAKPLERELKVAPKLQQDLTKKYEPQEVLDYEEQNN
jgi:hypothetical protein